MRPHGTRRAASKPWWSARNVRRDSAHNPNAFIAVSLVALIANAALAAYQLRRIRARRLNPLKDELYNDAKSYREVVEENR